MGERRGRGRPRNLQKRADILSAARSLFFKHGMTRVGIEQIAAEAGVSKMTVYAHFGEKDALFEAVVEAVADEMSDGIGPGAFRDLPLEQVLTRAGTRMLEILTSEEIQRFETILALEVAAQPALVDRFFRAGPDRIHKALTAALSDRVAAGELALDDPALAAEQLMGLWQGLLPVQRRFGLVPPLSGEALANRAAAGVRLFLDGAGRRSRGG